MRRRRRHAHASCSEAQTPSTGEGKQQHDAQGDAWNEGERRHMTWRDAPFPFASGVHTAMAAEASGRVVLFAVENHPVRQRAWFVLGDAHA